MISPLTTPYRTSRGKTSLASKRGPPAYHHSQENRLIFIGKEDRAVGGMSEGTKTRPTVPFSGVGVGWDGTGNGFLTRDVHVIICREGRDYYVTFGVNSSLTKFRQTIVWEPLRTASNDS
ncbi:hypothetical protein TNCT_281231 [Trichonephila clavata]|uniref:Uncharacterized protein n=1 Tax=Trichonephila clavata TaxID=2740835 RepID=A0A8X6H0G2_TRICU|nr:hypothetical protein TNCT_67331 [Trichonephila clavata]GFR08617.1 hypothetical protein TNCT_281231 [Trichonephila clavata]